MSGSPVIRRRSRLSVEPRAYSCNGQHPNEHDSFTQRDTPMAPKKAGPQNNGHLSLHEASHRLYSLLIRWTASC